MQLVVMLDAYCIIYLIILSCVNDLCLIACHCLCAGEPGESGPAGFSGRDGEDSSPGPQVSFGDGYNIFACGLTDC